MEEARYRSFGCSRNLEIVNVRTSNENQMCVVRSNSQFDPSSMKQHVVKETKSSRQSVKAWWNDPETKRRKRVAKYKFYAAEGRVKHSVKKGFRWFKNKCARIIAGF